MINKKICFFCDKYKLTIKPIKLNDHVNNALFFICKKCEDTKIKNRFDNSFIFYEMYTNRCLKKFYLLKGNKTLFDVFPEYTEKIKKYLEDYEPPTEPENSD